MARRRGRALDGWLIIDKPAGITSADVVNQARRLTQARKIGHGGTLDPMATGVLPLALGEATKTVAHAMDARKRYRFTVRWGVATDTDDAEGMALATSDVRPSPSTVESALTGFCGTITQVPPVYSAIKVNGRRAYDLARRDGTPPDLDPRDVEIFAFHLVDQPDADHGVFEVQSGKGTYMRALARDLARSMGTLGHIAALRRLSVGAFGEETAISLEDLARMGHDAASSEFLRPVAAALDDIPALSLTAPEAHRLRNGQSLPALPVLSRDRPDGLGPGVVLRAMEGERLVALVRLEGGEIRPTRVMNL